MIEGPSWIGIGAQRCGTTWFTDLLVQHPRMDVAGRGDAASGGKKEHHFLYRYGLTRDWSAAARDEYRATFTSDELKLGEFTPYYLRASWICELTADSLPEDAPLLVLVRDPIDRFASAVRRDMVQAVRRYRKNLKATTGTKSQANEHSPRRLLGIPIGGSRKLRREALLARAALASSRLRVQGSPTNARDLFQDLTWLRAVGSDASWGGMYAAQLDAWTAVLPEERFIVIQYEKLCQDPQHFADLVWKRLGLEPVPLSESRRRHVFGHEPEKWLPEDHPHVIRALQRIYRPDAERLADRFDIDLALWKRTMSSA
ncbi:MAG: hypothetical protein ACRDJV_07080 [Actinomycetota bacterium]